MGDLIRLRPKPNPTRDREAMAMKLASAGMFGHAFEMNNRAELRPADTSPCEILPYVADEKDGA